MTMEGKWKLESSENFDEYMKALGVSYMARKMGGSAKPTLTITESGGKVTMKSEAMKTNEMTFAFGVEFD